jgi:hypothetical protein
LIGQCQCVRHARSWDKQIDGLSSQDRRQHDDDTIRVDVPGAVYQAPDYNMHRSGMPRQMSLWRRDRCVDEVRMPRTVPVRAYVLRARSCRL